MKEHIEELNRVLLDIYQHANYFVSAYNSNPNKVFRSVVVHMPVVPYDLKERLEETFKHFSTQEADN